MNSVDAAWVAGIFEGEGTVCAYDRNEKDQTRNTPTYVLKVNMTDLDVIEALHQKTGVGKVYGPYKGGGSNGKDDWKEYWIWQVKKRSEIRQVLADILPFLYGRRSMEALSVLDIFDELDNQEKLRKEFCNKGHNRQEVGSNKRGDCLACVKIWQETHKLKQGGVTHGPNS